MQTTIDLQPGKVSGKAMKYTFAPESKPLDGYTIKRAIERGGFGEVYYALSDAGKEVALKLVQETNQDIELRGVSQCLNLKHPNLLAIFDIRKDSDGDSWVVMEYISGDSLSDALNNSPNGLTTERVLHWLGGIANGIEYLHERGIVHRDLKPANIYSEGDVVKVGDVGLSKFIAPSHHSATQSVGTVYYMAPEVAKGRYGREIDVYSLAVMLYEMLTGKVPFDGESTAEILMKHLSEKPDLTVFPLAYRPVLQRALEKDPQKRTPNVRQLFEEFERATKPRSQRREAPMPIPEDSFVLTDKDIFGAGRDRPSDENNPFRNARYADSNPNQNASNLVIAIVTIALLTLVMPPVGIALALGFGIWACLRALSGQPIATTANPQRRRTGYGVKQASRPKPQRKHKRAHKVNYQLTPETPRNISMRSRMTDLSGAMTVAPFLSMLMGIPFYYLMLNAEPPTTALFVLPTMVASWALLGFGKFVEGKAGSAFQRRVALTALGGLIGLGVYELNSFLLVDYFQPLSNFRADQGSIWGRDHDITTYLTTSMSQPTQAAHALFFACLFGLRRWWYHTDSFRSRRIRISSLVLTGMLGYLLSLVFNMPSDWATWWAVSTSLILQMSSVWIPQRDRQEHVEAV